ncbi:MAG TPA: RNA polymerase sigma factor [Streptosporangiaceae bacterium]|nr:RNA polymerase sigma factor [Streptosporangiaceae bacterium]
MASEVDDAFLVQRAQEGYVEAYSELTDRHGGLAYRVALRLLGNHHDAEDVAQEALITAWQRLPGFSARSSFSTWLYQIVTRRALNRISRTRSAESLELIDEVPDQAPDPGDTAVQRHAADAVINAITALPPPQRVVIVLHHLEGLSNSEVARITGSTVPAVRSQLFRGRRTLGKVLQEWR